MQKQDQDVIREFLVESHESLARLDQDLVELEKRPKDRQLLASIFRTIHTIKGTCGFLAFSSLEAITHQAETLLSQLREGQRELNPALITLILATVDATRKVLTSIEATGEEGPERFETLTESLRVAAAGKDREDVIQPDWKPEEETSKVSAAADANIRVGVGLLDKLMDLVGELVLTRNQILQFNTEREDPALNATAQRMNLITSELQEGVMKTRMQPIGVIWNKLPRVVRDISVALGKQIRIEMDGTETELDRTIIEAIKDPLIHLVRNACDHGVETPEVRTRVGKAATGTVTLRAYHEGGQVNIEICDDGAGFDLARLKQLAVEKRILLQEQVEKLSDREAMNLIFMPGFSTAKVVTNISGRGVGMDVVKSHIEKIGGIVDLASQPGEGCSVKLRIPLTLAIIPGLVVASGNRATATGTATGVGERFVIPQVSLVELIRLEGASGRAQIESIHGTPVYRRRGSLLPIAYLNSVLDLGSSNDSNVINIVVLQAEHRQFGLVVDSISDTQEIVVKPLGKQLKGLNIYSGATIMGDGCVALILDVLGIGQRSGVLSESREQTRGAIEQKAVAGLEQQRLLLFRAGSFERLAVPLSLVARLEEFPLSMIERAGGSMVVQYRDRILPLLTLSSLLDQGTTGLDPGSAGRAETADPAQVIVFNDGNHGLGVVVDQIIDVAEETVTVRQKTERLGLLGSAVVGTKIADFLDLNYVIRAAAGDWFEASSGPTVQKNILVAEASAFSRGLIRSGLDMAGYRVVEAGNLSEAIRGLEGQAVDVVVASMDLPPTGGSDLVAALRARQDWEHIPVLALAETLRQIQDGDGPAAMFQDCLVKSDHKAMLHSVARLASALAADGLTLVGVGK